MNNLIKEIKLLPCPACNQLPESNPNWHRCACSNQKCWLFGYLVNKIHWNTRTPSKDNWQCPKCGRTQQWEAMDEPPCNCEAEIHQPSEMKSFVSTFRDSIDMTCGEVVITEKEYKEIQADVLASVRPSKPSITKAEVVNISEIYFRAWLGDQETCARAIFAILSAAEVEVKE